jgi:hypothetical protein
MPKQIRTPDPERMNRRRAEAAEHAITAFTSYFGEKPCEGMTRLQRHDLLRQNLMDMLCDIAHFCDRKGIDFGLQLERASGHYSEKTNRRGKQFEFLLFPPHPLETAISAACLEFAREVPLPSPALVRCHMNSGHGKDAHVENHNCIDPRKISTRNRRSLNLREAQSE